MIHNRRNHGVTSYDMKSMDISDIDIQEVSEKLQMSEKSKRKYSEKMF